MRGASTSLTSMTARSRPSSRSCKVGGSDRGDRRGIGQHELDPGRRYRGVDRQIGRARSSVPPASRRSLPRSAPKAGLRSVPGLRPGRLIGAPIGWRRRRVRGTSCDVPSEVTATASGERATCAANNDGNRHSARTAGRVNAARLPISSTRACSPASSRSIEDNRRARVGGHGHHHSLQTARSVFRCWPRRTRRCGIPPSRRCRRAHRPRSSVRTRKTPGPCGRCGCPPASAWLARSPNASPATGSLLSCPGRFCQANAT